MGVRFVERGVFRLLGVQIRGNPMETDYSHLWHDLYMPRIAELEAYALGHECYGAYFATDVQGIDDIMAAKEVGPDAPVPDGLVARDVPAASYAVFDCQVKSIGPTWHAIFGEWMPTSGYSFDDGKAALEVYRPAEVAEHADAPVEIWVPVRKVG
jgi:AraC family transcriptional regulator